MKKLALVLLLVSSPVLAANATLTWSPPTQYTDNKPIPAGTVLTYNVYGGDCAVARPLPKLTATPITVATNVRSNISAGPKCYAVTAIVSGVESTLSAEVMIDIATLPSKPQPPAALKSVLTQ